MNEKRLRFLKVMLYVSVGVIGLRLFQIQILQKGQWEAKAEAQHTLENKIPAKRGEIYMMDGSEPVAVVMNEKVYTVIADPFTADEEQLGKELFTEDYKEYLLTELPDVFKDRTRRYFVVAKNIPREKALKLREKELKGIYIQENTKRVYPEGTMASRLFGFVNSDGEGQYGVEGSLDEELRGKDGMLKTIADVNNVALSIGKNNIKVSAEDGKDVVLTVDRNIQTKVEQILQNKLNEYGKDQGYALVMNPRNGEILAAVDLPGYNPADYGNVSDAGAYVNRVMTEAYEPASVCKGFAFATGIDMGVMNANSTYYNTDKIFIDGEEISNASQMGDGMLTMQTALNYSLNVGSTQVLRWLGGEHDINEKGKAILYDYYVNHFGLGKPTGIELFESQGWVNEPTEVGNHLYAGMTFGYNLLATTIQVASGYASMINGGEYYTPTIVKGYMEDGKLVEKEKSGPVRRTVTEETSRQMREMLWGTRSWWRTTGDDPAGYFIGGKTGTVDVELPGGGGRSATNTVATYVGFGGATGEMPEYLVALRIWKDGTVASGQAEALPIFTEISKFLIDYLKIKPGV